MLDTNLLFSNAQVVTVDAFSTNALDLGKTGADGVTVEVIVTAAATVTINRVTAFEKDTDAGWAVTDDQAGVGHESMHAIGRYSFRIATKKRYVKLYYDLTTAGSLTITAGIASGPPVGAIA